LLREPKSEQNRNLSVVRIDIVGGMYVRQAIQKSKIIGHAESGRSEFGPKEARLDKEKTPELASMGEASRKSEKKQKGQGSIITASSAPRNRGVKSRSHLQDAATTAKMFPFPS
jgi:hypothetical protein